MMTSAEFKTRREALGISQAWLAQTLEVSLRAVQHWEAGRNSVPEHVQEFIFGIETSLESFVSTVIKRIQKEDKKTIRLWRYQSEESLEKTKSKLNRYPLTTHAIAQLRIKEELLKLGYEVIFDYH